MYRVKLDDTILNDLPSGLDKPELMIVREDGFNNSDTILREKTEMQLEFRGDGYDYLCNAIKTNICSSVRLTIDKQCNGQYESFFSGIIAVSDITFNLKNCTTKQPIRDNSFTGFLKDYSKTQVGLYNTKTKNCLDLETIDDSFIFLLNPYDYAGTQVSRTAFDVLKVLKYIVSYFTDNEIDVKSDYLEMYRYAITTGFNLHNNSGAINKVYPALSYNTVLTELRKKLRLYAVVEYDVSGRPYIRIEHESYAFDSSTKLLSIPMRPFDAEQSFDKNRLFNSIEVGSDKTTLVDDPDHNYNDYLPGDSTLSFDKRLYNSCGQCTVPSDSEQNKLDLVSNWIIDTDLFVEALNQAATTSDKEYANDLNIFLFNYGYDPTYPRASIDTVEAGKKIYNASLRNANVINNWLGYSPQCISINRYSKYGFRAFRSAAAAGSVFAGGSCYFRRRQYTTSQILYDNSSSLGDESTSLASPCVGYTTTPYTTTVFHCVEAGQYDFHGLFGSVRQINGTGTVGHHVRYVLSIVGYTDNTLTTEVFRVDAMQEISDSKAVPATIEVQTGLQALVSGNVVLMEWSITYLDNSAVDQNDFLVRNEVFELTGDDFTCDDINDTEQNAKPIQVTFSQPLCYDDYKIIRENKRGYIEFLGKKFYVKEIKYKEKDVSNFTLIGNEPVCGCPTV